MTALLAGAFVRACADGASITRALARQVRTRPGLSLLERGALRVLCRGPAPLARAGLLCVLDGWIDNIAAVAAGLGRFTGGTPEEVLAAAYERHGADLLARLRGDFSLLIWDEPCQHGLLARDQLGVRSLYVHEAPGGVLCFATEIRELLELMAQRPAPDPAALACWLSARPPPAARTLYTGIRRLPPASVLSLSRERIGERRYWTPAFAGPPQESAADSAQRVRQVLERAVAGRMASGMTAVLMSGGLDSGSIAALAARAGRAGRGKVLACSAFFPEHPAVDESEQIESLRRFIGLEGIGAEVRAGGLIASALESLRAWQLPPLSWGDFWARPLLDAATRAGAQTVLGGDGGDELFATRLLLLADRLSEWRLRAVRALAREVPGAGAAPSRLALARALAPLVLTGLMPPGASGLRARARRGHPRWLRPALIGELMAAAEPPHAPELRGPRWWVDAAGGLALGIEGTGAFEMHRHRAALAGLEARHPLLDLDLVELALSVAPERSFDRRHNRPLLRSAVTGVLPEAVRTRRAKARFDSLVVDTLAGPDGHAVRGLLADRHAELHAYVDLARAERALLRVRPPVEASFAWMQQVWRLVSAECWLRAQADPELARLPELLRPSAARVTLRPFSPLTCAGAPIRCSTYASPRKEGTWRSATPTRSPS